VLLFVCCWFAAHTLLFRVMDRFQAAADLRDLRAALTVDNVNDVDEFDWTPLHYAAHSGNVDCVEYCIEMGAIVNTRAQEGWTPLHYASLYRWNVDVARVLLDAGAIIDASHATEDSIDTPLYWAIHKGHVALAKLLIDRGAKVSNVKLDEYLPAIPNWVNIFIESRSNCQFVSIVIIGIHKYRLTTVTGNNDINVLRLVSKHIWSTRMDDVWVDAAIETKRSRRNPEHGSTSK
jgi:hypothetical protein